MKQANLSARTIHRYHFISREDIVLTDGQPTNSDDEDNGMFDTVKNIYGVFDDSRFQKYILHNDGLQPDRY